MRALDTFGLCTVSVALTLVEWLAYFEDGSDFTRTTPCAAFPPSTRPLRNLSTPPSTSRLLILVRTYSSPASSMAILQL